MLTRLALVCLGLYVGVLGAVLHRQDSIGSLDLWWGLVLGTVTVIAVASAAGRLTRLGSAWFAVGWLLVLVLQDLGGSGSYLVADDTLGWLFMICGMGSCVAVVVRDSRLER